MQYASCGFAIVVAVLIAQPADALANTHEDTPRHAIFGPASFTLPDSQLFTFSKTFSAPRREREEEKEEERQEKKEGKEKEGREEAPATGPYLLRVKLSAPNTLTALSFKLNNAQVLSLADFGGGKTQVDRIVTVQAQNSILLQVAGKQGTVITVSIVVPPPVIFGQTPKDETLPGGSMPQIGAQYSSARSKINIHRVRLRLDGRDVTPHATVTEKAVVFEVPRPLSDATHTVELTVADRMGLRTTEIWSFLVDDPAPNFYSETPRDVFVADRRPRIRVLLSGFKIVPSSIRIALDGSDATAQANVATDHIVFNPANPLADGVHTVSVTAKDGRGVTTGKQWSFTVELPPPPSTTDDGVRTERTVIPSIRLPR